jgi:hypothetical protein
MSGCFSARYRKYPQLSGLLAVALCLNSGLIAADTAPVKLAVEAGTHAIEGFVAKFLEEVTQASTSRLSVNLG